MKNKIVYYLEKIIPKIDKLKHNFLGNIAFVLLLIIKVLFLLCFNVNISVLIISLIVLLISIYWEYTQKKEGGINSKKEIFLDLFFGNINHLIITICWILIN